jgi:hypothetical protein
MIWKFSCRDPFSALLSFAEGSSDLVIFMEKTSYSFVLAEVVKLATGNYIIPKEKKTFDDAQTACTSRGMGLVSLETLAENEVIQDYLGDLGNIQLLLHTKK